MGKFKFDFDNETFDFECPECGHNISFKGKNINHEVICPHCHSNIYIDGKIFEKQLKDIEKQLTNLFD